MKIIIGDSRVISPYEWTQKEIARGIFGAGARGRVWSVCRYTARQNTVRDNSCVSDVWADIMMYTCRRPEPLRTQVRIAFAESIRVIWLVSISFVSDVTFRSPLGSDSFISRKGCYWSDCNTRGKGPPACNGNRWGQWTASSWICFLHWMSMLLL